jgi:hypothetical protein
MGWEPNWNDVRWDHAAAGEMIAVLRQTAGILDTVSMELRHAALRSVAEWHGGHQQTFQERHARLLARIHEVRDRCGYAADMVQRVDHAARVEQCRRERERAEWEREQERKRERERERERRSKIDGAV